MDLSPLLPLAGWVATYLAHSTLLLGAAWLAARRLRMGPSTEELLWRGALLGPLVTTTVHLGGWSLVPGPALVELGPAAPAATSQLAPAAADLLAAPAPGVPFTAWAAGAIAIWGLGAGVGLLRIGRAWRALLRLLESRSPLAPGPTLRLLGRLRAAMGLLRPVAASTSPELPMPVALGLVRAEICLPEHAVEGLVPEQREGLIAHELGHVARRDPAWRLLHRVMEAVLFVQPLNRLAARRLEALAEILSDDRAVLATGHRLELAHCLVKVAHWGRAELAAAPAATALPTPGELAVRVRRLLDTSARREPCADRRLLAGLAAGLLVAALLLPGVSLRAETGGPAPAASPGRSPAAAAPGPRPPAPPASPAPSPAPAEAPSSPSAAPPSPPGPPADLRRSLPGDDAAPASPPSDPALAAAPVPDVAPSPGPAAEARRSPKPGTGADERRPRETRLARERVAAERAALERERVAARRDVEQLREELRRVAERTAREQRERIREAATTARAQAEMKRQEALQRHRELLERHRAELHRRREQELSRKGTEPPEGIREREATPRPE